MPKRVEPIVDADGRRLCGICRQLPVGAGNLRKRVYRCQPCHKRLSRPAEARYRFTDKRRAALARYRNSPKGLVQHKKYRARRIFIGAQYYSSAKTAEEAAVIQAHIRRRIHAFVEGQQASKKAQGL